MKELIAATTAVLGLSSALALAILPPISYDRAACIHVGSRPVITQPAPSAPAASRCVLPATPKA